MSFPGVNRSVAVSHKMDSISSALKILSVGTDHIEARIAAAAETIGVEREVPPLEIYPLLRVQT